MYCKEKWAKQAKKLPQEKIFLQLHSNFQLFAICLRAFHGESITFLEINLVPNLLNNVKNMPKKYWFILRTLRNPTYLEPGYIQNPGIIRTWGICRTLAYSEPEANSEHCQTSTMKCWKKLLTAIIFFCKLQLFLQY